MPSTSEDGSILAFKIGRTEKRIEFGFVSTNAILSRFVFESHEDTMELNVGMMNMAIVVERMDFGADDDGRGGVWTF